MIGLVHGFAPGFVRLFRRHDLRRPPQDGAGRAEFGRQFVHRCNEVNLDLIDVLRRGAKNGEETLIDPTTAPA